MPVQMAAKMEPASTCVEGVDGWVAHEAAEHLPMERFNVAPLLLVVPACMLLSLLDSAACLPMPAGTGYVSTFRRALLLAAPCI